MESVPKQTSKPADLHDVEMIGSPNSPKPAKPDVHMIENERAHGKETFDDKPGADEVETVPTQPLLEPDKEHQKPPLADPEMDDLDGDDKATDKTPLSGIDDGLLEPDKKPNGTSGDNPEDQEKDLTGDGVTTEDGKWWPHGGDELDYPTFGGGTYGTNGISSRAHFDDRPVSPMLGSIPDVNTYQQKKNLAQGMMDLALLSANANQLRYVLESSSSHPYYYSSLTFISLSIIFQIGVGIGLIMNSRYNVKNDKDICKADKINNMTVLGIFLITIVNVFITSFSVATPNSISTAVQTRGSV